MSLLAKYSHWSRIKSILLTALILGSFSVQAQNAKATTIVYEYAYPKGNPYPPNVVTSVTVVGESAVVVKSFLENGEVKSSFNTDCGKTTFADIGNSTFMKQELDLTRKHYAGSKATVSAEIFQILGLPCRKFTQEIPGLTYITYVYEQGNTQCLPNPFSAEVPNGFVLKAEMIFPKFGTKESTSMVYTAISLKTDDLVDPAIFVIPDNYKIQTMEEMMKVAGVTKQVLDEATIQEQRKQQRKELWNEIAWNLIKAAEQELLNDRSSKKNEE